MNVVSKKLVELNKLCKKLPHTDTYPTYMPHITIAYLNKGEGMNFMDKTFTLTVDNIGKIIYSKTNGDQIEIPIG